MPFSKMISEGKLKVGNNEFESTDVSKKKGNVIQKRCNALL